MLITDRLTMQISRLVLPGVTVLKRSEGSIKGTGLPLHLLLEQLIVSGSSKIVITSPYSYEDDLSTLPEIYRHYVEISDNKDRANRIVQDLLRPIYDELEIETDVGIAFTGPGVSSNERHVQEAICLFHDLEEFLTALFCRAQFHFDVDMVLSRLSHLFDNVNEQTSRAHLACLIPIFRSYRRLDVAGAHVIAAPEIELADRLVGIVRSAEFRALSETRHSLGIGRSLEIVVSELKHRTRKLLGIKPAKAAIDLASKAVSATSGIPMPTTELAESFLAERFLPPALNLSRQIENAKARFLLNAQDSADEEYIIL